MSSEFFKFSHDPASHILLTGKRLLDRRIIDYIRFRLDRLCKEPELNPNFRYSGKKSYLTIANVGVFVGASLVNFIDWYMR